jgi:hypothetical protein
MPSFMRRCRRWVALVLLVVLAAPRAHAVLDPTAPVRIAILLRIAAITAEIHKVADAISRATRAIQERQEELFPREALREIGSVFQQVRSLRQELDDLGHGWTLTANATRFRDTLTGEARLVRDEWEALWGRADGPGRDLHDYAGWGANRRYRSAASYLEVHDDWQTSASRLAHQARAGGLGEASALRSLRLTAVGSALALQQAVAANKLAAEQLDGLQQDLDEERYREVMAESLGAVLLRPLLSAAPGGRS